MCLDELLYPPINLQASVTGGDDVNLTWEPSDADQWLRYDDGVNVDAVGLTVGGTFGASARFPSSVTFPLTGKVLTQMEIYIWSLPSNCTIKIYGQGTPTSPGSVLLSQDVTSLITSANSWYLLTLSSPVPITGDDIWIGYEVTHLAGEYPAGLDAGPANPDGEWFGVGGSWSRLGFNENYNIAGFVTDPGPNGKLNTIPLAYNSSHPKVKNDQLKKIEVSNTKFSFTGIKGSVQTVSNFINSKTNLSDLQLNNGNGAIDATFTGYNVYRNDVEIAHNITPLLYNDLNRPAGSYSYKVTSQYVQGESAPAGPVNVVIVPAPAVIPFTETFETWPNNWSVLNGTQTNQWFVGAVAGAHGGSNSAYVSNDGGTTYAYTNTATSVVHLFRDIQLSNSQGAGYNFKFWWKGNGEATYDFLKVYLVETSVTPVEGIELTTGQIGTEYSMVGTNYVEVTITIPEALTGTTKRLVFSWKNDNTVGTNPPVSIDDITITAVPFTPALSGDYTVGVSAFNKITGKNIYFDKVVNKVMKEVDVEVPAVEKGKELQAETTTSFKTETVKRLMEVEEISWIPMENGQPYTGDLYVNKADHPEIDFPEGTDGVYSTITLAVAALNAGGVTGPVRFLLTDATYPSETFPITVNILSASLPTATNTVTIRPNVGVTSLIQGAVANSRLFWIRNSYVSIDGSNSGGTDRSLTIENTSTTGPQVIVFGSTGTTPIVGNVLKNCNIINGATSSSAVIVTDGTTPGNAGYFTNITIQNNSIQKAYIAVYNNAVVAPGNGNGLLIIGNDLNTSGTNALGNVGIYVQGVDGATVTGNNIANFESVSGQTDRAIWFASGTKNSIAEKNKIDNIGYSGSFGYGGMGIAVSSATTAANNVVRNNFISHMFGDGDSYVTFGGTYSPIGIYIYSTQTGIDVYFNSVNLYGNTLNYDANSASFGIFLGTGSTADIQDNIIVNNLGLLGATGYGSIGVYLQTAVAQLEMSNYNDIFVNATGTGVKNVGQVAATGYITLADWQTATTQDANSISANPEFISDTDLHITPGSTVVAGMGVTIATVTTDIDGDTRLNPPDIGADEFGAGATTFDFSVPSNQRVEYGISPGIKSTRSECRYLVAKPNGNSMGIQWYFIRSKNNYNTWRRLLDEKRRC